MRIRPILVNLSLRLPLKKNHSIGSSDVKASEHNSLGFLSLELGGFLIPTSTPNSKLENQGLLHSVTSNSELLLK